MKESSADLDQIKNVLNNVVEDIRETKNNVSKNQDNLMTVISNMMKTSSRKSELEDKVRVQEIKTDEEKFKTKFAFFGKVVGILLGSGGIVYVLIDILIK